MNILVINWQDWTNPLSGGAETHLYETFRRIVALGHSVTVFCSGFHGAASDEVIDGIKIIRRGSRSTFNFIVPFYYLTHLRHLSFDVVVDDMNKIPFYTPLFVSKPLVGLCHHFFGTSIFYESGLIVGSYVYLSEKFVDFIYKKIPFLVVSQSTIEEFVRRRFDRLHFTLAMNSINHERLKPGDVKSQEPLIAYVGRLKKYKSVDHVIRAFAKLKPSIPKARLIIVGRGDYQAPLEKLVRELGIESSTKFIGFITEEEKVLLLQQIWTVVNPSIKEGWGIVNIEANACGTPAIAADSPGLRDSVIDGKTGLLYPYGDIDSLTEKLELLINNDQLRKQLGINGIEFASSLRWDNTAVTVIGVLEKAISEKK